MSSTRRFVFALALLPLVGTDSYADFSIDPFSSSPSSDQFVAVFGGNTGMLSAQNSLADPSVVGGVRNITLTRTSANRGNLTADVSESVPGFFSFNTSNRTTGSATLLYDGSTTNTSSSPNFSTGLGNVDVTQLGVDKGVLFQADSNVPVTVTFTFYTDANDYYQGTYVVPGDINETIQTNFLAFTSFTKVGAGANLTKINAISVLIDGTSTQSTDMGIAFISTAATSPEPSSIILILLGLATVAPIEARRRSRKLREAASRD